MTGILQGKHVLLTGAGRGLGEAYARAVAQEGARVVLADRDASTVAAVAESIERDGGEALAVAADITDWDQCEALVAKATSRFGKLDGLVNNAGVLEIIKAGDEDEAHIRRHMEVNVCGTYFMSVHGLRAMQGRGSIINITSAALVGLRTMNAYAASKGAVASLTFAWAAEFGANGSDIRVNAFAPHADTPMMAAGTESYSKYFGGTTAHPPPASNAPAIVYLLSDLSEGVNGQIVRLANGRDLMLMTHPAVLEPVLTRESWTTQTLSEAFDREFRERLQPVGTLHHTDARIVESTTRAFRAADES